MASQFSGLLSNPVFRANGDGSSPSSTPERRDHPNDPKNLIVSDKRNILYLWNPFSKTLHSICLSDDKIYEYNNLPLSEPVSFDVDRLLLSKNGRTLLLIGQSRALLVNVEPCLSKKFQNSPTSLKSNYISNDNIFFPESKHLKILKVTFHPYSNTHVGILTSDKIFRIFDLSKNIDHPEQEFLLSPKSNPSNLSTKPVSFSFGGDNLWERFTVFFLYSDMSIYFLCPVVPFGSLVPIGSVHQLIKDSSYGMNKDDTLTQRNCRLSLSWLQNVFPANPRYIKKQNISKPAQSLESFIHKSFVKAQSMPINDATIELQGPLPSGRVGQPSDSPLNQNEGASQNFTALDFVCSTVGKDSLIIILTQNGRIVINELSDEIQPLWIVGRRPKFTFYDDGSLCCVSMIASNDDVTKSLNFPSIPQSKKILLDHEEEELEWERKEKLRKGKMKLGEEVVVGSEVRKDRVTIDVANDVDGIYGNGREGSAPSDPNLHSWRGMLPLLLQIGEVDLEIEESVRETSFLSIFSDPLIPQRFFCLHPFGVDAIVQRDLLFVSKPEESDVIPSKVEGQEVYSVIELSKGQETDFPRVLGYETLLKSSGEVCLMVWVDTGACILATCPVWDFGIKDSTDSWKEKNEQKLRKSVEEEGRSENDVEYSTPNLAELLQGHHQIPVPHFGNDGKLMASSLEGKNVLRKACIHFHEHVRFLDSVYVELMCKIKRMYLNYQDTEKAKNELIRFIQRNASSIKKLNDQIQRIELKKVQLSKRIEALNSHPCLHRQPLSKEEKQFIQELDLLQSQSIHSIQSNIDELEDRVSRLLKQKMQMLEASQIDAAIPKRQVPLSHSQMSKINSAVSSINDRIEDMFSQIKIAESSIHLNESQISHNR